MAGFWGRRKQEREELRAQDAELDRRASAALVATDERIRTTVDELAYAEIELGTDATKPLREALAAVKTHLQEAFQLNQLNHDEKPDTDEERRIRNARIVQLCDWAEDLLDDRTEALQKPIERARRAPRSSPGSGGTWNDCPPGSSRCVKRPNGSGRDTRTRPPPRSRTMRRKRKSF